MSASEKIKATVNKLCHRRSGFLDLFELLPSFSVKSFRYKSQKVSCIFFKCPAA